MQDRRDRRRDVAITRALGYEVYIMPAIANYKNVSEGKDFKFEPIFELVPVIMEHGCSFFMDIIGDKFVYVLNMVPNYDTNYKELDTLCQHTLSELGWQLQSLHQNEDSTWDCTYYHHETDESISITADRELEARAECACMILCGTEWYDNYQEPELISYVPVQLSSEYVIGEDDQDDE